MSPLYLSMRRLVFAAALAALALPAVAQSSPPADAGIQVVGAWTLTVTDPDGAVVEERAFHNDLVPSGASVLSRLLIGALSHGRWYIRAQGSPSPCGSAGCQIDEIAAPNAEPYWFGTLTSNLVASTAGGSFDTLVLSGSLEATQDGVIDQVSTVEVHCQGTVAPEDCAPGQTDRTFTSRRLDAGSELAVAAGQTVNVRVEISFQ